MTGSALVVMAAGIASRYGGLKQVDPIGPSGEILLDYSVYDALHSGFAEVVFVIRREIEEAVRRKVDATIGARCKIRYVFQSIEDMPSGLQLPPGRKKPWGTAHAVWACRDVIHGPFAVINADDFYGRTSFSILRQWLSGARDRKEVHNICIIGYPLENTLSPHGAVSRALCKITSDGYLEEISELKHVRRHGSRIEYRAEDGSWTPVPKKSVVSMNMWGFTPSIFEVLERQFGYFLKNEAENLETAEYLLPEAVGKLVREGKARVRVLLTSDHWFGVTYREDRMIARERIKDLIRLGIYPSRLWGESMR